MPDGTRIWVELAALADSDEAAAVCETEAATTELAAQPGTFSGNPLGDSSWTWCSPTGSQRFLVRSGRYVVSLRALGADQTGDNGDLLETLARTGLKHILKGE